MTTGGAGGGHSGSQLRPEAASLLHSVLMQGAGGRVRGWVSGNDRSWSHPLLDHSQASLTCPLSSGLRGSANITSLLVTLECFHEVIPRGVGFLWPVLG